MALALLAWTAPSAALAYYDANYQNPYAYEYAPTRLTALNECDDCTATVTLPFLFPYYGKTYNQVTVSANGFLVMGVQDPFPFNYYNVPLNWSGTATAPDAMIAPLWDDWVTVNDGSVWTGDFGDHFVIEWWGVRPWGGASWEVYAFEVKLFPSGRFEFHYHTVKPGNVAHDRGASATIGYQHRNDTVGHPVSYNWPIAVDDQVSYAFSRPLGPVAYMSATDFFQQPRTQQVFEGVAHCYSTPSYDPVYLASSATNAGGVARAQVACLGPAIMPRFVNMRWAWSEDGGSTATSANQQLWWEESTAGDLRSHFAFFRQSGFTPRHSLTANYGAKGFVDYWQGGSSLDKVLLVVPGFDPLDTDTTARYLALMSAIAPTLLQQGYDIAIGNYASPNRDLFQLVGDVQTWINDAWGRNQATDKRVQVAGLSQGGVVVRQALATGSDWQAKAWYSIDAPQLGANLGRATRGLFTLVFCNQGLGDPDFKKLNSIPARQLALEYANHFDCTCKPNSWPFPNYPENDHCTPHTTVHDTFYAALLWPTTPGHVMAFGDGDQTNPGPDGATLKKQGAGNLFSFNYGGSCSNAAWVGNGFDCNAGSRHNALNQSFSASFPCNTFAIQTAYPPSFINVHSALGGGSLTASPFPLPELDSNCSQNYTNLGPSPYWGGRVWVNNVNGEHSVLPAGAATQLLGWVQGN